MNQFDISPETAVVTTSYVTKDGEPVLYVSHEVDDEDGSIVWQFHSGNGDYSSDKLQLVRLATVLELDESLRELAEMPIGYSARRAGVGSPWEVTPEV